MEGSDKVDTIIQLREYILNRREIDIEPADLNLEINLFINEVTNPSEKMKSFYYSLDPMSYWNMLGASKFPTLFIVAKAVYSVSCSQEASEQVWSIYNFIHSKRRNRLSAEKTTKFVSLYANADIAQNECNMLDVNMGKESDFEDENEGG
eukprot:NODE_646_length_5050_cov_1.281155.p3 type:complete len:150 gc:universal NODE_646_length_5050_cov_1.281155:4385-4834(+)